MELDETLQALYLVAWLGLSPEKKKSPKVEMLVRKKGIQIFHTGKPKKPRPDGRRRYPKKEVSGSIPRLFFFLPFFYLYFLPLPFLLFFFTHLFFRSFFFIFIHPLFSLPSFLFF